MGWGQDDPKQLGACHMSQAYLSIDPKAPWKSIRVQVEDEAKGLLLQKPQLSQHKEFLQRSRGTFSTYVKSVIGPTLNLRI